MMQSANRRQKMEVMDLFKIPFEDADIPYIKCVAYRDGYSVVFEMEFNEDDEFQAQYAVIGADEELREEFLEDVQCERESAMHGGTPVYSLRTVLNPEKLGRLMKLNNSRAFVILKQDEQDYLKL